MSTRARTQRQLERVADRGEPEQLQRAFAEIEHEARFRELYRMLNPPHDEHQDGTASARG